MKFTNVKQLIIKFMGGGLINFPTRFLRWVKINGDSDDSDDGGGGGDDGGLSKITMKDAMLKFNNNMISAGCPIAPKKAFKGIISNYTSWDSSANPIYLDFINGNTRNIYTTDSLERLVDLEDITEDFFEPETDNYNDWHITFLYDLDDLNGLQDEIGYPVSSVYCYGEDIPIVNTYQNHISDQCSNVLIVGDKKYVWFQDWD